MTIIYLYYWLVFLFCIGAPLLPEYSKYFVFLYAILVFGIALKNRIPKPRRFMSLYAYLGINCFALLAHTNDIDSVVNAGSLVVSILAITGVGYFLVAHYDNSACHRIMVRSLAVSLAVSFVLSIILTATGWPTAPAYFPWESLWTENRLLLLVGGDVGHAPVLWLCAFLMAFLLHDIFTGRRQRAINVALLIFLVVLLLATKSRLAIVYLVQLLITALAYKRIPFARPATLAFPVIFVVFFLSASMSPALGIAITTTAHAVQKYVGDTVRLTPSKDSGATALAGRDLLNQALVVESLKQPLIGLGHSAPVLLYGVTRNGDLTSQSTDSKMAASESVLRIPVKYGWPYFGVLVAFLFSIPFAMRGFKDNAWLLRISIWGMCLESVISEGGMEQYYGIQGLFLLVLSIFYFQGKQAARAQKYTRGALPTLPELNRP